MELLWTYKTKNYCCILTKNLGGLRFGVDGDGNYGYYGADDSLIPFSSINLKNSIWTNPSPNVSFDAQNIPLDLKNYKYLIIYTRGMYTGETTPNLYTILPKGVTGQIVGGFGTAQFGARDCSFTDSGVTFGTGYTRNLEGKLLNGVNGNPFGIPVKIYGAR